MADTGSDVNAPSEEKDVSDGQNLSDDIVEVVSDGNQDVNGESEVDDISIDATNVSGGNQHVNGEMDDNLEKLAQMREILFQKGISEDTQICLGTMVKVIMTPSVPFYKFLTPDCYKEYYVEYFEDVQNLWAEIMNNMPTPFRMYNKLALTAAVTAFDRRLSDINVLGESMLSKLPNLLTALENDDMESFKWSLDGLNAEIIVLYVILSSYFQMLEKLKALMG